MRFLRLKQALRSMTRNLLLATGVISTGYAVLFRVAQWFPLIIVGLVLIALAARWRKAGPMPTLRGILSSIASVTVIVVVTLLLFEYAARPILSEQIPWGVPVLKPHGELMYTLRPNTEGDLHFVQDDGSRGAYPIRISSQGLRDDDIGPARPDEFRIMMLGDSFTFGHGLTIEESIPRQLQWVLRESLPDKDISVINAGVVGYGPWQEHGLMREVGFDMKPDLVILQLLPSNDISDTMLHDLKVPRSYSRTNSNMKVTRLFAERDWKMGLDVWFMDNSSVYKSLYIGSQSEYSVSRLLNAVRLFHNPEFPSFPPPMERAYYIETDLREWYPELEAGWTSFEKDVSALVKDCQDRGIEVITVVIPTGTVFLIGYWKTAIRMSKGAARYDRGKGYQMTQAFVENQGIPNVSLDDIAEDQDDPGDLYYLLDGHFKPLGARVVSERIAERVLQDYIVKP